MYQYQSFRRIVATARLNSQGDTSNLWTSLTQRPAAFSNSLTERPEPRSFDVNEILTTPFNREGVKVNTLRDVLSDSDSPYHISKWKPPTLYPINSEQPMYLMLFGSYTHPIGKIYTHKWVYYSRGAELETWRLYGKRPLRSISKFVAYEDCVPYTFHYWKGTHGRRLVDLLQRRTFKPYAGVDMLPAPSTSLYLDFPLVGEIVQPVTRDFAQRWARGGYVYPESETIVNLDVVLCHYWQQMTYPERALMLTNREHSLLAAYYAIPKLNRVQPTHLEYHADAPIYGG
ncbi:hypothetical protein [Plectonema phage JingP1]|uniref:Uncharacterized protein n=1 Tax=Plectonema phage JingP1 TaxID=2961687 RepID=A0A9E7NLY0_9CAUD|nr:hypothetical protein [Plectonema phage JingP1]